MNETQSQLLLSLIWTFLLIHCCYSDITIQRDKVLNSLNFTETYTISDNVTSKCPTNFYALVDVSGVVKCLAEQQISDSSTKGCVFNPSVPSICELKTDDPISGRLVDQSEWSLFKTDCLKVTNGSIVNSCGNLAGWLFRVELQCRNTNLAPCAILSFEGKYKKDLLVPKVTTATTTTTAPIASNTTSKTTSNKNTSKPTTTTTTTTANTTSQAIFNTTENNNNNNKSVVTTPTTSTTTLSTTTKNATDNATIIVLPTTTLATPTTLITNNNNNSNNNNNNNRSDDKGEDKNILLYIILPVCFVLVLLVLFCLYCFRKRILKRHQASLPLLEINPGKDFDDDNIEEIYAVPKKKAKKKKNKKKKGTNGEEPPTIWPNYDEVGQVIEGTYEQRESTNLDDPLNKKYGGVSARLFQDGADGGDNHSGAVLSLSPTSSFLQTGNVEDDPYEKLGRCNSFTPKTRAEKTKEMIELKEKRKEEEEEDEKNSPEEKFITGPEVDHSKDLQNQDTSSAQKKSDGVNTAPKDNDGVDLPFVGGKTSIKPMEMGSFKPGASIRKKQQRTSMKKPNKGTNGEDRNKPSETHEEVKITPLPLKKNFAKNHTPNGDGGSAFSSCEKIPDIVDGGKQSPTAPSDIVGSDEKKSLSLPQASSINNDNNKSISPQASFDHEDSKDSVEAKIDNDIKDGNDSASSPDVDGTISPDKNEKPEPTTYADIEIIKQNDKYKKDDLNHGTLKSDITMNGNYTDVIIADD